MLMLAIGSFLFGILLLVLKYKRTNPQNVPFWISAKILQGAGSLMLYYRIYNFDGLTMLANIALLLGCAYEAWAVRALTGQVVKRRIHVLASIGIILLCSLTIFFREPYRVVLIMFMQSVFYFLPCLFLFFGKDVKSSLQIILSTSYFVAGLVFLLSAIVYSDILVNPFCLEKSIVNNMRPVMSFCIFLISGYIMLMLAKEKSDMEVQKIQRSLKKSEIRYQQIVETALEGILIFDKNYKITFANKNMASLLGYKVDEMIGRPYISFFPESQMDVYYYQESLRKRGEDSIYECCLMRKDGKKHWFLVSAKAIFDDNGKFAGSFAMLADIHERKEMELLMAESNRQLTELSNKDSLTGIANRRCFDATLEHEYSRLMRSNSKLSLQALAWLQLSIYQEYPWRKS